MSRELIRPPARNHSGSNTTAMRAKMSATRIVVITKRPKIVSTRLDAAENRGTGYGWTARGHSRFRPHPDDGRPMVDPEPGPARRRGVSRRARRRRRSQPGWRRAAVDQWYVCRVHDLQHE